MNNKFKIYPQILAATFILGACATAPTEELTDNASRVTVLSEVNLTDLEKMRKIGSGSCEIGSNIRSSKTNMLTCKNYLRNQAAEKNSDYIVFVSSSKSGITTASLEADFYVKK